MKDQPQVRHYLNNMSDSPITVGLTTQRVIQPKTSMPLNSRDIEIFKILKEDRKGEPSLLDNLHLSTIDLKEDSRFKEVPTTKKDKLTKENKSSKETKTML
jgi:hypothetical protein